MKGHEKEKKEEKEMELSTLYRERTLDKLSEDDIGKVL